MKLKDLLNEVNEPTENEALKIANTKLKQLGFKSIKEFNSGWGDHNKDPFRYDIGVPKELKLILKSFAVFIEAGYDTHHWKYSPNPGIFLKITLRPEAIDTPINNRNGYTMSIEYPLKTKKWTSIEMEKY